jgi:hypothetical protein
MIIADKNVNEEAQTISVSILHTCVDFFIHLYYYPVCKGKIQGDQIGRIFAYWAIVCFGHFSELK